MLIGGIEMDAGMLTLSHGEQWAFQRRDTNEYCLLVGKVLHWWDLAKCEGLILEFGVRGGDTIKEIALSGSKVYGFDWWRGLPHDWDEHHPKGSCLAVKPVVPDNVELIEGLFSDTLEGFLETHPGPVGFANIDCDLYAPTIYILHTLKERFVPGTMLAFSAMSLFPTLMQKDAWDRYLKETGQKWQCIGKQHHWGEVYRLLDQ